VWRRAGAGLVLTVLASGAATQDLGAAAQREKQRRERLRRERGARPSPSFSDLAPSAAWTTFVAPAGEFSVELPATPVALDEDVRYDRGSAPRRTFQSAAAGVTYVVSVSDLPAGLVRRPSDVAALFETVQHEQAREHARPIGGRAVIGLQGHTGREFELGCPDPEDDVDLHPLEVLRPPPVCPAHVTRVYLVGTRLFVLTMHGPEESLDERFFTSFRMGPLDSDLAFTLSQDRAGMAVEKDMETTDSSILTINLLKRDRDRLDAEISEKKLELYDLQGGSIETRSASGKSTGRRAAR
jgi:hypothetical protein